MPVHKIEVCVHGVVLTEVVGGRGSPVVALKQSVQDAQEVDLAAATLSEGTGEGMIMLGGCGYWHSNHYGIGVGEDKLESKCGCMYVVTLVFGFFFFTHNPTWLFHLAFVYM